MQPALSFHKFRPLVHNHHRHHPTQAIDLSVQHVTRSLSSIDLELRVAQLTAHTLGKAITA